MLYINAQSSKKEFEELRRSTYFVDKTGLISALVPYIGTTEAYVCITRPRRYGKTINARTLACFLSQGLDAAKLFDGLEVSKDEQAMKHLGAHDVIYIDFSEQPFGCKNYEQYIGAIKKVLFLIYVTYTHKQGFHLTNRIYFLLLK